MSILIVYFVIKSVGTYCYMLEKYVIYLCQKWVFNTTFYKKNASNDIE